MTITEYLCIDCIEGDHEACRREGGWPHQDTNERCGCHLTEHRFDNRVADLAVRAARAIGGSPVHAATAIQSVCNTLPADSPPVSPPTPGSDRP